MAPGLEKCEIINDKFFNRTVGNGRDRSLQSSFRFYSFIGEASCLFINSFTKSSFCILIS